jgi:hypothetical protein
MTRFSKPLLGLTMISAFALTACVSQEQADAKMGKGCQSAVEAMISPKTLVSVKSIKFSNDQTEGSLYRHVTVQALEKDGWIEMDKEYECLFAQQWGFLKSSHTALLERMTYGDVTLGKVNGKIMGSLDDFMKLTTSAETAMGQ